MNEMEAPESTRYVVINTDGACSGNPGWGGWAATLRQMDGAAVVKFKAISGGRPDTTNNQMELDAAIGALGMIKNNARGNLIIVRSDSQYLVKGMNEWRHKWQANGWRTASKKPVENADQWRRLIELAKGKNIEWQWVRGHSGDPQNEQVDRLATKAIQIVMFQ